MAKLYITEFQDLTTDPRGGGGGMSAGKLPYLGTQVVTYTTTSVQSVAFGTSTRFVRVQADANCHIKAGSNPTATTSDLPLTAGVPEYFGVTPGDKIAAVAAA